MGSGSEGGREFAAALRATAKNVVPEVEKTMFKASMNIKKQMQADIRKSRHFGQLARAVTFDIEATASGVSSEIGPESGRGKPGALLNIGYFGAARGGGGTIADPQGALDDELPALEKYLAEVIVEGLE